MANYADTHGTQMQYLISYKNTSQTRVILMLHSPNLMLHSPNLMFNDEFVSQALLTKTVQIARNNIVDHARQIYHLFNARNLNIPTRKNQ